MFASIFQRVKILTEVLPAVQSFIPSRTKYTYSRKKVCGVWNKRSAKPIKKHQRPVEENLVRFLCLYSTRLPMPSQCQVTFNYLIVTIFYEDSRFSRIEILLT